jgi:hypothetical protein
MTAHVARIKDDLVSFTQHYELDDGEKLISSADMRFRSEQAIREAVETAGLAIEQIYGGGSVSRSARPMASLWSSRGVPAK